MSSKNHRTPLLHYAKLCAASQTPRRIQTGFTVRKLSIRVKTCNFLSHVTLKFDGWLWKTIGRLFYATLRFVHHFKAISELKLELQSGNAPFRSKSVIFCPVRPWNLTDDLKKTIGHLFYATLSFVHHFKAIDELTGFTVRKCSIRVKIGDFLSRVTLKFDGWPWKTIGHLFYVASSFMLHFIAISEFKLKLQSGNAQFGSKLASFCPVWPWNLTDDLEKQ